MQIFHFQLKSFNSFRKLFDISDLKITDDKLKSVKHYKKSAKVINFLKQRLNPKAIFINVKADNKDVNKIIQEGIKSLLCQRCNIFKKLLNIILLLGIYRYIMVIFQYER
jgi:hypothetical protein